MKNKKNLFTMVKSKGDEELFGVALKIARAGNPTLSMAEVIRLALRAYVDGAKQTADFQPAKENA